MVKRYLKGGVMENGVITEIEEGSPQGGNLSPLLANVYLNEFDWEFHRRGVPCIRYADDIVLLAKSERAAERLLESSTKYLEETLKLKVNREKSRTVSVFAIRNFKFIGFCFGKSGKGIYIRVHGKSWKKAKEKLRQFTSRSKCGSIIRAMEKIKVYMRGWVNYYGIADIMFVIKQSIYGYIKINKVVKCLCGENRKENPNKCLQISLVCDKIQISYAKYGQETPERLSEAAADGKTKERFEVWQSSILKYGVPTSTI